MPLIIEWGKDGLIVEILPRQAGEKTEASRAYKENGSLFSMH